MRGIGDRIDMNTSEVQRPTLNEIASFLQRFGDRLGSLQRQRYNEFVGRFEAVRSHWEDFQSEWSQYQRIHAPALNVFQILQVEHDEERTHSRLLRWLLDPRESHGQGTYLLDRFLECCLESEPTQKDDWRARTEVWMPDGRIDIVLSSASERRLIVIENKIYAAEQPRQLQRYGEWMDRQSTTYDPAKAKLVYLTLDGHPSTTAAGRPYLQLAYGPMIVDWLTSAMERPVARQPPIADQTVPRDTEETLVMEYEKEVVKFLSERDNIGLALEVAEHIDAVKDELVEAILDQVIDRTASSHEHCLRMDSHEERRV